MNVTKESKKLTNILKGIFGDVVESGHIVTANYLYKDGKNNSEVEFKRVENSLPVLIDQDDFNDFYFDWSCAEFVMKLTNGKFVRMGNSEWAHMSTHANLEDAVNDY